MHNLIPYYISEQFKNNILKGSFKAYTMFVDISGFTKLTEMIMKHEKDGAEVLTEVLNIIFNPLVKNIYENGGIISKTSVNTSAPSFSCFINVSVSFVKPEISTNIVYALNEPLSLLFLYCSEM